MRDQISPSSRADDSQGSPDSPVPATPSRKWGRLRRFWSKHRTLFWTLHSVWALATGVIVIWLAHERYGFVPWVLLFLGLTWLSTFYFGRAVAAAPEGVQGSDIPGAADEATSYLTRVMYQESLFFLLPFYAYSTVIDSPNVLFIVLLGGLAIASCLDLMFDRWLRGSRVASLLFFTLVAFAGVNLLIPMLLPMDPTTATQIAAGVAIASALPLVIHGHRPSRRGAGLIALTVAIFLSVVIGFPRLVPPVPLRLQNASFASNIDRASLEPVDTLSGTVRSGALGDGLYVRLEVFAPSSTPTHVDLRWERNGIPLQTSRTIEITAHQLGFRIWGVWRPESGGVVPGRYEVILETRARRVFGSATILVTP